MSRIAERSRHPADATHVFIKVALRRLDHAALAQQRVDTFVPFTGTWLGR